MKKIIIITSAGIVFATLFYTQNLGINALLYSLFLIIAVAISSKKMIFKSTVVISGLAMLASATAISMHGSPWSIATYFLSTFMYIGYVASFQSSIYVSWLNGIYNAVFGVFHSFVYQQEQSEAVQPKKVINTGQIIKIIVIPFVLVIVFTGLYSISSPVFNEWLAAIDLSFINISWLFTAALGAFIMANIHSPKPIKDLTEQDLNYANQLTPNHLNELQLNSVKNESQIGFISILCLNVLLVVVLITEVLFLTDIPDSTAKVLSDAVHQGVYASIISIVLAIGIITFIFRGDVNFIKNNEKLRILTYVWIGLNALLVLSIFVKNYTYIDVYGLTHKRIGVLVYLLLTIIGLVTTYLKVSYRFNFVYLLRRNMLIGYAVISVYSIFNWSSIITDYNIKEQKMSASYLESLLPQNALVLKKHGLYKDYKSTYNHKPYNEADFIDRNWQEFNWIAHKIQQDNEGVSE